MSKKLEYLFLFAVSLFIAHGFEEYWTGFYAIDSQVRFIFGFLESSASLQTIFLVFQITLWILLVAAYFVIKRGWWLRPILILMGFIFIYELHHLYKAIAVGGYYPGLLTALVFPVLGFFYWLELLSLFARDERR